MPHVTPGIQLLYKSLCKWAYHIHWQVLTVFSSGPQREKYQTHKPGVHGCCSHEASSMSVHA